MTPKGIANCILFHQIDLATKNCGKLIKHLHPIIESDSTTRFEGYQPVHVTSRTEIISQRGTEERKFRDFPASAEFRNHF